MASIIFNYEGAKYKMHCNINDKIEDKINKFLTKLDIQTEQNKICFLYNNNIISNYDLTFNELLNDVDRNKKKIHIYVRKVEDNKNDIKQIISKDVICLGCEENVLIDIKNFKINMYGCKRNHVINDIPLNQYEENQTKN